MKHTSHFLFFLSSNYIISFTVNSFLISHVPWGVFSFIGTNGIIAFSTHDAMAFPPIFSCMRDGFFLLSLEPSYLSTSITKSPVTTLFSSSLLLLLSLSYASLTLFSSVSITVYSSSSLLFFSQNNHNLCMLFHLDHCVPASMSIMCTREHFFA